MAGSAKWNTGRGRSFKTKQEVNKKTQASYLYIYINQLFEAILGCQAVLCQSVLTARLCYVRWQAVPCQSVLAARCWLYRASLCQLLAVLCQSVHAAGCQPRVAVVLPDLRLVTSLMSMCLFGGLQPSSRSTTSHLSVCLLSSLFCLAPRLTVPCRRSPPKWQLIPMPLPAPTLIRHLTAPLGVQHISFQPEKQLPVVLRLIALRVG